MSRRVCALFIVVCLAFMLMPPQAMAADIPKLLVTEVMPNGKNVPHPVTGATYNEAFELIEIYNNSKQSIALKDIKLFFGPAGAETELAWIEGSEEKVLPAGGVMIIWPKQSTNPFTINDYFKHNQAKNPDLNIEQIAIVQGPQMHNTQPRSGYLASADGTIICKFAYDGVSTETVDDKAIRYAYPTDGSNQVRKISYGTPSTPGILDADQIPPAQ